MIAPQKRTPAGGPGSRRARSGQAATSWKVYQRPGIETLLARLDRVKQTGPGRWMARCPAHEDRSPSLSLKQCDDGTILLHDFGGCGAADVLTAIGMELRDLFPDDWGKRGAGPRADWRRCQLQAALDREELILELARADQAGGKRLSPADLSRALQARDRAPALREKLHGRG